MSSLREVNDDILKDRLKFREDDISSIASAEDKSILFALRGFRRKF